MFKTKDILTKEKVKIYIYCRHGVKNYTAFIKRHLLFSQQHFKLPL